MCKNDMQENLLKKIRSNQLADGELSRLTKQIESCVKYFWNFLRRSTDIWLALWKLIHEWITCIWLENETQPAITC